MQERKSYILQLIVSYFHDHQAILQSKAQTTLYTVGMRYMKESVSTFDNNGGISKDFREGVAVF